MTRTQSVVRPSVEVLQDLYHLRDLGSSALSQLASRLEVFHAPRGVHLIEFGNKDETTFYLLDGEVELLAVDGEKRNILASDSAALRPLCRLRPARYQVTSRSAVSYILIENDVLNDYLPFEDTSSILVEDSYLINESNSQLSENTDNAIISSIIDDLNHGRLILPSLPLVAEKVGRAILYAGNDKRRLAKALLTDPGLTTKIIRAVNTKLAAHQSPVNSCEEAIEHLGIDRTVSFVINCVLRETLRSDNPLIIERMQSWWEKSIRVSAISSILARLSERFDPEFAGLAGLLHRIGEAIVLDYASRMTDPFSADELDHCILNNANEVGRIALTMWNLSYELISVVNESGNLTRSHNQAPDYTDIVLVAELHADIGHQNVFAEPLPSPEDIPAFHRLGLNNISPEFSVKIIETSSNALHQAEESLVA